jgi:hypothetical protein
MRRVCWRLIDFLGLDLLGDDGWGVMAGVLLFLLGTPLVIVYTASVLPLYDPLGWLHVWRVKLPLAVYFLAVFALAARAALHVRTSRRMLRPRLHAVKVCVCVCVCIYIYKYIGRIH